MTREDSLRQSIVLCARPLSFEIAQSGYQIDSGDRQAGRLDSSMLWCALISSCSSYQERYSVCKALELLIELSRVYVVYS